MARRRKTKSERDQERYEVDRRAWEAFRPRLESLQSYAEAMQLVAESPRPDSPGRKYYSNLAFFLGGFTVPMGSNYEEKALYLQLIQRIDKAGQLKPGAREKIEAEL